MIEAEIIIIGGGPAGSSCAWKLNRAGRDVILLDKKTFPRLKLCAGWITPKVINDLRIDLDNYPHSLVRFDHLNCSFRGLKIPIRTRQYSIRRIEFDHWLLQRARVKLFDHAAKNIVYKNGRYTIDDAYQCKYLIGAGGTYCPVYNTFFRELNPRAVEQNIVALEEEFAYDYADENCYLWFFDHKLTGYSWYVPKGSGNLNVGIGGKVVPLKKRDETIREHWQRLVIKLENKGLVTGHSFQPKGYQYYLRHNIDIVQKDNALIIGDSVGLATIDMGEGIGPAVESGLLAADAIIQNKDFSLQAIGRYSLPVILFPSRYS